MNNQADTRSPKLPESTRMLRRADQAIEAELDALGLTTREILSRLGRLSEATKTMLATKDGEFTDEMEIPDNPVRMAAVETLLKLRSAFPSSKLEVSGTFRVEQLQSLAIRLEGLPPERLQEIIDAEDVTPLLLEAPDVDEVRPTDMP